MKRLAARLVCLLLCLALSPACAVAEQRYLIPDSDTRYLSWWELWEWDYESLGYILNEIFARHGYNFNPGEKYDNYFRCMPWYTPNANPNNTVACYPKLNEIEWANEALVKEVRQAMRDRHTANPDSKSVWDVFSPGFDTLQGFDYLTVKTGLSLPVYAAPSLSAWRGANGKASVSTAGHVFAAGWESGWLLVMYETNQGSVRVGYVSAASLGGNSVSCQTRLSFEYADAAITARCELTDDPARAYAPMATLAEGTRVTYLTTYFNNRSWAYVETTVNGQTARGFVPAGSIVVEDGEGGTGH